MLVIGERHGAIQVASDVELRGGSAAEKPKTASVYAPHSRRDVGSPSDHGRGGFTTKFTLIERAVGLFIKEELLADLGSGKAIDHARLTGIGREDGEVAVFQRNGSFTADHDRRGIDVAAVGGGGAGVVTPEFFSGNVRNAMKAVRGASSPMLAVTAATAYDEGVS